MFLERQQYFLAVLADAMTTSNDIEVALRSSRTRTTVPSRISRTIGSSASERAFQGPPVGLHLPPHSAHRVLADRTAEQRRECSADPARVGAGEVRTCNQRVGCPRAALIGPQCLALPLPRLAVRAVEPERQCGGRLFERTGRGVVLTELGQRIAPQGDYALLDG